ncbi:MAG: right-handed parallel beta-helix repeat-containing protein [Blastocatellia bacterium]|nr:right-handed parallel beta-helix repeat-containing protein [Blastocatellia bacterium]
MHSRALPKLISATVEPVVLAVDGAHHYRFVAVEFGGTKDGVGNIIQLGTSQEKRIEDLPHHIEFDRVFIHATSPLGQRRGIAANGKFVKIINSHIEGIRRKGDESQAIAAWSTDGPIEIVNNYLEAAAINILFGGGAPVLPLVPTDCIVKDNHLNKPIEWKGTDWVVKNLFEIKNGKRIRIENNLMTHNWGMGQDGMAVLFTTRMDSGEATVIEDITFTGNIVRGSGGALSVMGGEGAGGRRLTVSNNVFEDIDGSKWNSAGRFMKASDWDGLVIDNNTILQTGNISVAWGESVKGFVFRNNIVFENEYGFAGDGTRPGRDVIEKYFSNGEVRGNIIIGGSDRNYDRTNILLPSISGIQFRDPGNGDYRLAADSPYRRRGVGGTHIGADLDPRTVGRSMVP